MDASHQFQQGDRVHANHCCLSFGTFLLKSKFSKGSSGFNETNSDIHIPLVIPYTNTTTAINDNVEAVAYVTLSTKNCTRVDYIRNVYKYEKCSVGIEITFYIKSLRSIR